MPLKALESPSGGNFLAASALLAAISGCSVLFYRAGPEAFERPYESDLAYNLFDRSRELYRGIANTLGQANCHAGLGQIALARDQHDRAREHLQHAQRLYQQLGCKDGEDNCLHGIGAVDRAHSGVEAPDDLPQPHKIPDDNA